LLTINYAYVLGIRLHQPVSRDVRPWPMAVNQCFTDSCLLHKPLSPVPLRYKNPAWLLAGVTLPPIVY